MSWQGSAQFHARYHGNHGLGRDTLLLDRQRYNASCRIVTGSRNNRIRCAGRLAANRVSRDGTL